MRQAARILDLILSDEIGHVAIGNRWFHWLCRQRGLEPGAADARHCSAAWHPGAARAI